MITPEFIEKCSKQLKELADRVSAVIVHSCFNIELSTADFLDDYPENKLSKLVDWSNEITDCKFIYIFSKNGGLNEQKLFKLYKEAKKKEKDLNGKRAFARANRESPILYVGSSNSLESRIRQHLGHKDSTVFSMQLKHWLERDSIDLLKIKVWKFDAKTPQDAIQAIEDYLWEELQPMLGKQGGK
jgi:hypothetical protein